MINIIQIDKRIKCASLFLSEDKIYERKKEGGGCLAWYDAGLERNKILPEILCALALEGSNPSHRVFFYKNI